MAGDDATSALLLRISARQLANFTGGVVSLFERPPVPPLVRDQRNAEAIAHILRTRILVAKHLFKDVNNRRAIITIVIRLFLTSSTSEYAALLLDSWKMDDVWVADVHHELCRIVNAISAHSARNKLTHLSGQHRKAERDDEIGIGRLWWLQRRS